MTAPSPSVSGPSPRPVLGGGAGDVPREARLTAFAIAVATLIRLTFLTRSHLELYGDEAQYWAWAQHLAFGYYTKPPLIAWVIAATTALFGEGEAAVRVAAPLFHAGTAALLYQLGRRLADPAPEAPRLGLIAALLWLTAPGVSFSAVIISTDAPLLFFVVLALVAYAGLWRGIGAARANTLMLALAIGLGLLTKLAMAYLALGLVLHAALDPSARALWRRPAPWAALGLGLILYAPNLVWNALHGGATYAHLAENAGVGRALFHPEALGAFVLAQFGVFGPIPLSLLILTAARAGAWRAPVTGAALAFAVPVLVLMCGQSLLTRAFANWAAFAYGAGAIVAAWALIPRPRLLAATLILQVVVALALYGWGLGLIKPPIERDPVAALTGFKRMGIEIAHQWRDSGAPTLIAVDRMEMARLLYYIPNPPGEIRMFSSDGRAHNEFDLSAPLDAASGVHALLVTRWPDPAPFAGRFAKVEMRAVLSMPRPRAAPLKYYLFEVANYRPPDGGAPEPPSVEPEADRQADKPSR